MGCDEGKAWINPDLWREFDALQKEDAAHAIWFTCAGLEGKTSTAKAHDVDICDMQSGKKLASYSKRHGFRVY